MDISRVQLGILNNYSVPLGSKYNNYTHNADTAILYKPIGDTLYVTVEQSLNQEEDTTLQGWINAFIDWNRDGEFTIDEAIMSMKVKVGETVKSVVRTNPAQNPNIINGYTRMRVMLHQDRTTNPGLADVIKGEVEDYMVQIRSLDSVNAALYWFVTPVEFNEKGKDSITVRVRNVGSKDLPASTPIYWSKDGGQTWGQHTIGQNLTCGKDANVTLAYDVIIDTGLTHFIAYVDASDDQGRYNDTIDLHSILFERHTLPYFNNFDSAGKNTNDFYIWEPRYDYPSNCWQIGTPDATTKTTIKEAYNGSENCLITKLEGKYPNNNLSIIYSPMYEISIVKPDTMMFMLRRKLVSGTNMIIQHKSRSDKNWKTLGQYNDGYGINWYDNSAGKGSFANITNSNWLQVGYSMEHIWRAGNMENSNVQFRIVFRSGATVNTNDGFAIDDFQIRRALERYDAGAVAIELDPQLPNFGNVLTPTVWVRNFGYDTLRNFTINYISYDIKSADGTPMYIPQQRVIDSSMGYAIPKYDSMPFVMPPVTIGSETSASFKIIAWASATNEVMNYRNNDTTTLDGLIAPLLNDAGLVEFIAPEPVLAVNDDVKVTVRVKNYGVVNIKDIPVAYKLSNETTIHRDTIHLIAPLSFGNTATFTFRETFNANFGWVDIKAWVDMENDDYRQNDSIATRIHSITNMKDLVADMVVIDDSDPSTLAIQLNFLNRSTSPLDNIQVGYYVNGDISTAVTEQYKNGGQILATSMGYHNFSTKLPRQYYSSICGFVHVIDDADGTNDTTCNRTFGYADARADSVLIEDVGEETCRLQVWATNCGTLGASSAQVIYYVRADGVTHQCQREWNPSEVGSSFGKTLTASCNIPRHADGNYDVKVWIKYPNDNNPSNDTTKTYRVVNYVGLDSMLATNSDRFILEQNTPNPFDNATEIGFILPYEGKINFYIANNEGKQVYSTKGTYSAGHHILTLKNLDLPQGVYYYTMEFDGSRLTRKMLTVK